jgi:hypothetical protein
MFNSGAPLDDDDDLYEGDDVFERDAIFLSTGSCAAPAFDLLDLGLDHSAPYVAIQPGLNLEAFTQGKLSLRDEFQVAAAVFAKSLIAIPDLNGIYAVFITIERVSTFDLQSLSQTVILFMKPRHLDMTGRKLSWYVIVAGYSDAQAVFDTPETQRSLALAKLIPDMPSSIKDVWLTIIE